jgi:hypothetical protein
VRCRPSALYKEVSVDSQRQRAGEAVLSSGKDKSTPDSGSFATPYLRTFSWNIFAGGGTNYRAGWPLCFSGVLLEVKIGRGLTARTRAGQGNGANPVPAGHVTARSATIH